MKKKLLTIITSIFCFIGFAQVFTIDDINYEIISGTNEVMVINSNYEGDLVIPKEVKNNGTTYTVTHIKDRALENAGLTSVITPSTLLSIGDYAFSGNNLTYLFIGGDPTIGNYAFANNYNHSFYLPLGFFHKKFTNVGEGVLAYGSMDALSTFSLEITRFEDKILKGNSFTTLYIPNCIISIGKEAFRQNSLRTISIPDSVTSIEEAAFMDNRLTNIIFPSSITDIGNFAFSNNPLTDIIALGETPAITLESASGSLGDDVFHNRSNIDLVVPMGAKDQYINAGWINFKSINEFFIVDGIMYKIISETINEVTIIDNLEIETVDLILPEEVTHNGITYNVTGIGSYAFEDNKLETVTIPSSVKTIGNKAFKGNKLTSISIPNGVTFIGSNAFSYNDLTNITISNSVTTIEDSAFSYNELIEVIIPNSVTSIGDSVFNRNKLTSIVMSDNITYIGKDAFKLNNLTNVIIPEGVTEIGKYAFYGNELTNITIPNTVTIIDESAFSDNPYLTAVIALGKTPAVTSENTSEKLDDNVFGDRSTIDLVVPAGILADYTAAGWTGFKSVTEFTVWSGANGSDWTDTGNWNENLIALTSQNAVIPNVANFPVISSGLTAEMNDLSIEEFSSFSIEDNGAAIVNGDLNSAETITINSSATTSGTFIVKGTVNGTVSFEKSGLLANEWSLITAPVSGQSIKDFVENTANEIRVNTTVTPNRYAVAYYDDSKAEGSKWVYYTTDDLASNTISFEKGKSYIVSRATNGSILFTGNMETTDVDVNVNANQWNTIGSPYTAYLPINANSDNNFIKENLSKLDPLYQSVYIWDASQNKYIAKTLLDTDTSLNAGQGFLIKTNTGVSSITFKESHRLPNATTTTLSRSRNRSSIRLIANQNDVQVTTKINYINNTTKGLDPGYDIGNFKGTSFDVFTHLVEGNENTDFTVQSLPDSDYETTVIPVGLQSDAGKEISLTIDTDNIPANLNVYLEDTATGKFINLTKEKPYTFKTTSKLEGIGRFYLHTSSKILNTEDEIELTQNLEIVKSGKQEITIQGLVNNKQVTVSLYSVLGNEVYKQVAIPQGMLTIQPNRLDTGVYIVKVESLQGTITKKVIFK